MSFDKTKAMRNAERFLSQGKLRAAITEYQRVVEFDPRDYSTMNILGDLYAKDNDNVEAVSCFRQVAEHYSKQGFAQKAIAVYNKISRLDPNLVEVSEKLAQLYQSRGSFAEARNHYATLAEKYQRDGRKAEALETWKEIAKLDPNNTEVYLKIAEFCLQNNQKDEAVKAYTEAGMRLAGLDQVESALTAFTRALEIRQYDLAALNGYVKAQIKLGYSDDAADRLEKILAQSPYNREILYLLVDCHLEANNLQSAEEAIVRLVEQEPANYPKFIELVELYINAGELESAARVLAMSSEHLLVGGKHEEFLQWTNEIVARDPEQLEALRLLVRYHGWQRDERELKSALERLAEIARLHEEVDDEKYALTQLILIAPHEIAHAQRLQEIKIELGEVSNLVGPADSEPNAADYHGRTGYETAEDLTSAERSDTPAFDVVIGQHQDSPWAPAPEMFANGSAATNGHAEKRKVGEISFQVEEEDIITEGPEAAFDDSVAPDFGLPTESDAYSFDGEPSPLSASDELRLSQEIESIEFYIAQGYMELADRSICALEAEFGNRPELNGLRERISSNCTEDEADEVQESAGYFEEATPDTPPMVAGPAIEVVTEAEIAPEPVFGATRDDFLDEFRNELGLEEAPVPDDEDYETVFHTAVAYREMGLLEDAIRGFQDAVNRVRPTDGTRRFFQCCNLLGLCFVEKGMPNLAIMWYRRAMETPNLNSEESNAMLYEMGSSYAAAGDQSKAVECFEQIYAVNVGYRDVSVRLEKLCSPTPH